MRVAANRSAHALGGRACLLLPSPSTVDVWLISCTERHEPELALPGRGANVHERPALHLRGQSRRRAS
jgi:hypothetical protein